MNTDFIRRSAPGEPTQRTLALQSDLILLVQLLLLVLLLSASAQPVQAQRAPDNRLAVALRTLAGQPAPGVTITLTPRPSAAGGPAGAQQSRTAPTDNKGWAAFDRVASGIWLLSLAGSAEGLPLQPAADQGKAPYGTNTQGGGFMIAVGELGDDIGADDSGIAQSRVAQALFVGQARNGVWVPEYDLSDISQTPQPLSLVPTIAPFTALTPASAAPDFAAMESPAPGAQPRATRSALTVTDPLSSTTSGGFGDNSALAITPLLFCYAPGLLLGVGLLGWAWLRRAVKLAKP